MLAFDLGAWAVPCAAQSTALQLSLADALDRAEEHAPELVMAGHAVRKAEAQRTGAGVVMPQNPRISADVRSPADSGWAKDAGYGAMLDLLFEVGGAPAARVREANKGVAVARAEGELERMHARLRVWAAYLQAQISQLRIEHAHSAAELAQRVLAAAKKRVEMGAASDLELTSAQLELAQIEVAGQAAVREHDERLMALRDALDLDARQALALTTLVEDPPALAQVDRYVERARRAHPLTAASDARLRALEATRERLEREKTPRVGLYGGIDSAPASHSFAIFGVSVELPFAQRNQGPLAVNARAQQAEAGWRVLSEHRIERGVVAAWQSYELRRAELEMLSNAALPAAQRSFQLAEAGFSAGRFDWFRVAVAARDLVRVRAERLDALAAAWAQRIAVEQAVGGQVP
ncbi:MAG TPA: TolC family protein [Polyangiales bacterium]